MSKTNVKVTAAANVPATIGTGRGIRLALLPSDQIKPLSPACG